MSKSAQQVETNGLVRRTDPLPTASSPNRDDQMRRLATTFFRHDDPRKAIRAIIPEIPSVYPESVFKEVRSRIDSVVGSGSRLYLRGATAGVGASRLVSDYANSFNWTKEMNGSAERIAVARIFPQTKTIKDFLDTLAGALQAPFSNTERRFRCPAYLGQRILSAARGQGVTTLIIDHVSNASSDLRGVFAELMMITDPTYNVSLNSDDPERTAIGIVLVDHLEPEVVFRRSPEVLTLLDGAVTTLEPYQTVEEVAEAIKCAEIGMWDLHLENDEDRWIAEIVLEKTSGLICLMNPLLSNIGAIVRLSEGDRPTLAVVEQAANYVEQLIVLHRQANHRGAAGYITSARGTGTQSEESDSSSGNGKKRRGRHKALEEKRNTRHLAAAENKRLQRSSGTAIG